VYATLPLGVSKRNTPVNSAACTFLLPQLTPRYSHTTWEPGIPVGCINSRDCSLSAISPLVIDSWVITKADLFRASLIGIFKATRCCSGDSFRNMLEACGSILCVVMNFSISGLGTESG